MWEEIFSFPFCSLNLLQNLTDSQIFKNLFCHLHVWWSLQLITMHVALRWLITLSCSGPRNSWDMGLSLLKPGKIPVKLGWVGTSQSNGCSNLDTELSYFMDLPKNHQLTNISWPTFLISFFILLLLRDKYNSLFLGRGVRSPFPKSWHQPFQGPKASASSPSKLITTFLDKNTVFSSGGLLAITVFNLSSYWFSYPTIVFWRVFLICDNLSHLSHGP